MILALTLAVPAFVHAGTDTSSCDKKEPNWKACVYALTVARPAIHEMFNGTGLGYAPWLHTDIAKADGKGPDAFGFHSYGVYQHVETDWRGDVGFAVRFTHPKSLSGLDAAKKFKLDPTQYADMVNSRTQSMTDNVCDEFVLRSLIDLGGTVWVYAYFDSGGNETFNITSCKTARPMK